MMAAAMYETLRQRVGVMLGRAREVKAQTERQLTSRMAEHSSSGVAGFMLCAADVLEDYELDMLFGPLFTPTVDERAEVADLLFHWRPSAEQLSQLVGDLLKDVSHTMVKLPDGTEARLTLHEVMVERLVRLLRLDNAPDGATAAAVRDALPAELWPIAVALMCEPGMTRAHQQWVAMLVNHVVGRRKITRPMLETVVEFVASQIDLSREKLLAAAEALLRASEGTAAFTASGHAYWSADVAQHHHYRGQGNVDQERLQQRQAEVEYVAALVEDLRTLESQ
jgi:hypothetical protein